MLPGVYAATKKNGDIYYRSNITYQNKHISLGSFPSQQEAHLAYLEAQRLLSDPDLLLENAFHLSTILEFHKVISLLNFRDNHIYFKNPIYLKNNYFLYYISRTDELKFDIDDLFYYSNHKIMRRKGHLFVNDYGMQVSILSRYGIKSYAVCGRDYYFANDDPTDLRYANIIIVNRFQGVTKYMENGIPRYQVKIHINGNFTIGTYETEEVAAIAYNKAADLAKKNGFNRNFTTNYVENISPKEYADIYSRITISEKFLKFLLENSNTGLLNEGTEH